MTTVLITGATGSIGRKIRAHLAASGGYSLRLLCANPDRDPAVTTADLAVYDEAWARHFAGVDSVIHLAGASSTLASWDVVQRLNVDLSLNVLRAAELHGARRIVFASSNWVVAGHRFGDLRLTPDMPPWPVNPYGAGKLFIERAGADFAQRTGISFLALRIGYCQHSPGNIPGPHMEHGVWGQQMWLSDRDLCQALEKSVTAAPIDFAVLNVMSDNPGMRWELEETRRAIGYHPLDAHLAVEPPDNGEKERFAGAARDIIDRLAWLSGKW